jgi:hypothetical protein
MGTGFSERGTLKGLIRLPKANQALVPFPEN